MTNTASLPRRVARKIREHAPAALTCTAVAASVGLCGYVLYKQVQYANATITLARAFGPLGVHNMADLDKLHFEEVKDA